MKDDHDEDCLREYFGKFGNVTAVTIVTDKDTLKKRGFGFVEFDDYDPVDKVVCKYLKYVFASELINVWGMEYVVGRKPKLWMRVF